MRNPADDTRREPIEQLLLTVMFAPVVVGAKVLESIPTAVERARRRVEAAHFLGKMAVGEGVRQVRERLADGGGEASAPPPAVPDAPERDAVEASDAPDAEELALPDYDQLPAAHIVAKLGGLSDAEIDAVERYERSHRHRRTVLGKIDQLRNG